MIYLGALTCALALVMAFIAGLALYRAEAAGRHGRPYVLPVFVGVAYVVLQGLALHDAAAGGEPRVAVQAAGQLIQTLLILSVIMLLHRSNKRRGGR